MKPLKKPPSFDYKSVPPYKVIHERIEEIEEWDIRTVKSALVFFYKGYFAEFEQRVVLDGRGKTVLGLTVNGRTNQEMVGTREAADFMLNAIADQSDATQMEVLDIVEGLRAGNGRYE